MAHVSQDSQKNDVSPRRASGAAATRRSRTIGRAERIILPVATLVAVFLIWEIVTALGILPARFIPPPTQIFVAVGEIVISGAVLQPLLQTLAGALIGLAIATIIGTIAGTAIGINTYVHRALRPVIEFMRPVPSIATIPLVVLVLGIGFESKIFLVAFGSVWPILIQTMYGVRDADPVGLETGRVFGLSPTRALTRIRMPNALPYIVTGVRISASISLIVAITAELVIGMQGLGLAITNAQQAGAFAQMYAYVGIAGVVGVLFNVVLRAVERRLLRWHASQRRSM